MNKMLILAAAIAALGTGLAYAGTGPRDVYTDGARTTKPDPYLDGAKATRFDVFTDGASIVDKRDAFTDGA